MSRLMNQQMFSFVLRALHQHLINQGMYNPTKSNFFPQLRTLFQKTSSLDGCISKSKSAKMITIKDKIEQHDYTSKLNNIKKWLSKGYPVKAVILNVSQDVKKNEQLYDSLSKDLVSFGKLERKKSSTRETKFIIEPTVSKADEPPSKSA